MIIAHISHGLGNQLFQYASARGLAALRGVDLKIHATAAVRPPELEQFPLVLRIRQFNIEAPDATRDEIRAVRGRGRENTLVKYFWATARRLHPTLHGGLFKERETCFDPMFMKLPANIYLEGYFQSQRYFAHVADQLRREFTFRDPSFLARARAKVDQLRSRPGQKVVGVHVRRGDLAHATEVLRKRVVHGPPVSAEYLRAAMARFPPDSHFFVFSESTRDFGWCREHVKGPNVSYCEGQNDLDDFATMQCCDHMIMSNSTFSWWAAWLNTNPEKRIIAPRNWFFPGVYREEHFRDLVPEPWELLTVASEGDA